MHNVITRSDGGLFHRGFGRLPRGIVAVCGAVVGMVMLLAVALAPFGATANATTTTSGMSLTISAKVGDGDSARPLAGDTYSVAYVAKMKLNADGTAIAGFKTNTRFEAVDHDWGKLTSSQYSAAAKEVAAYADKHDGYNRTDMRTDANGKVTIPSLDYGLYLVKRVGVADANKAYKCDPFFVTIPETNGSTNTDDWDYRVTASPKFEQISVPGPTPSSPTPAPTPTAPGGSSIAKTGAAVMRYVEAVVILGAVAFAIMFIRTQLRLRREER
ncbi:prealbumin-like fold domain-containing protein [Bifidobacterium primatium]|uniref:prealbumin-like fold domain-containing protein n=1 Tax=Bifidobacterium primatium TaxID=2045438 RepID=UPI001054FCF8|nr:prealbumin-like fold domain-containing protein [Bifidobacterium primatium]